MSSAYVSAIATIAGLVIGAVTIGIRRRATEWFVLLAEWLISVLARRERPTFGLVQGIKERLVARIVEFESHGRLNNEWSARLRNPDEVVDLIAVARRAQTKGLDDRA